MTIETYYVNAKSKKALNDCLASGLTVLAVNHSMFNSCTKDILNLQDGDVIKIWDKKSMGSPVAKSYGNWDSKKQRVK